MPDKEPIGQPVNEGPKVERSRDARFEEHVESLQTYGRRRWPHLDISRLAERVRSIRQNRERPYELLRKKTEAGIDHGPWESREIAKPNEIDTLVADIDMDTIEVNFQRDIELYKIVLRQTSFALPRIQREEISKRESKFRKSNASNRRMMAKKLGDEVDGAALGLFEENIKILSGIGNGHKQEVEDLLKHFNNGGDELKIRVAREALYRTDLAVEREFDRELGKYTATLSDGGRTEDEIREELELLSAKFKPKRNIDRIGMIKDLIQIRYATYSKNFEAYLEIMQNLGSTQEEIAVLRDTFASADEKGKIAIAKTLVGKIDAQTISRFKDQQKETQSRMIAGEYTPKSVMEAVDIQKDFFRNLPFKDRLDMLSIASPADSWPK